MRQVERNDFSSLPVASARRRTSPIPSHQKTWKLWIRDVAHCLEPLEVRILFSSAAGSVNELETGNPPPALALIDIRLPDQQLLVQSLPNITKIFFDSDSESAASVLQQAVDSAKTFGGSLQSVMIFSHGEPGGFELGDDLISSDTLSDTVSLWKMLGQEMAPGRSIDLFGCDSALGTAGQNLLDQIHALSDVGVFGSTNITGKDGDWTLEASSVGAVETNPLPMNYALLSEYPADLGLVTIQTAASANPSNVARMTSTLSVLAADTSGESHVTYTWSATVTPLGANPIFSVNGSNAAKNTTVTFNQAGLYTFTVTASDGLFFAISLIPVTVTQTLSRIAVAPSSGTLDSNQSQIFTATGYDQFGQALTIPAAITWSVDAGGVGTIDTLGVYSAGAIAGSATVRATDGLISGIANVVVTAAAAPIVTLPTLPSLPPALQIPIVTSLLPVLQTQVLAPLQPILQIPILPALPPILPVPTLPPLPPVLPLPPVVPVVPVLPVGPVPPIVPVVPVTPLPPVLPLSPVLPIRPIIPIPDDPVLVGLIPAQPGLPSSGNAPIAAADAPSAAAPGEARRGGESCGDDRYKRDAHGGFSQYFCCHHRDYYRNYLAIADTGLVFGQHVYISAGVAMV